jgi:hypothetical protein
VVPIVTETPAEIAVITPTPVADPAITSVAGAAGVKIEIVMPIYNPFVFVVDIVADPDTAVVIINMPNGASCVTSNSELCDLVDDAPI